MILPKQIATTISSSPLGGGAATTSAKLFITGATVGPIVDSFHNQCLLKYNIAPISLSWPTITTNAVTNAIAAADGSAAAIDGAITTTNNYFFCSSWVVPPLLGFAYVVLGYALPKLVEQIVMTPLSSTTEEEKDEMIETSSSTSKNNIKELRSRGVAAVLTTAIIIKLSEYLEISGAFMDANTNIAILMVAALLQWYTLDRTIVALLIASIVSLGGPLSELPFVAYGFWEYLPEARDYFPLLNNGELINSISPFQIPTELALSSITGPCYFAVTMDAIALGRWFGYRSPSTDTNILNK